MFLFLLIAIFGFVLSLIVHVRTFGNHPVAMARLWPLHVGTFVVFLLMIIAQKRRGEPSARNKGGSTSDIFSLTPAWMRALLAICFLYAIFTFALFIVRDWREGRMGTTLSGHHVVIRNNKIVRAVGDEEYRRYEARTAREASVYWMIFYGAAALGLYDAMLRRRQTEPLIATASAAPPLR
jgi:hypothetical protein